MSTKCKGINKNGKGCKNKTKSQDGYCHKHKKHNHEKIKIDLSKIDIIDLTKDENTFVIKNECCHQSQECNECCICYEKTIPTKQKLDCDHYVCMTCIKKLRDDRCPLCRHVISSNFITDAMKTTMKQRKKEDFHYRATELDREYMNDFVTGPWNNTRSSTHSRYLHNNSGPAQNTRSATRRRQQDLQNIIIV
jgi:hypothetical protein